MSSFCNVQLRIISGHELPKTDLFSHIDPYVVVSFRGEVVGRTASRENNPNPVWNEDFFFEAEQDEDGALCGTLTLDLYDEEVTRDEHVGSIVLDLQTLGPETLLEPVELPVAFKADRRGQKLAKSARRARLAVQIVGLGKGFSSYAEDLAEVEGALLDEASSSFLVPVPDTDGLVWAGMRFGPRHAYLVLLSCQDPKQAPNPAPWYELSYPYGASLRVERLVYRRPVKMMGLKVWSELRATNVPLGANLSKVRIVERPHRLVDTLDPADLLVSYNYMIGMPFLAAVKELSKRGAHVDTAGQSIWIKMDSNQPQPAQLLQLDYSPAALADAAAAAAAAALAANAGPGSPRTPGGGDGGGKGGGDKNGGGGPAKFPVMRICSTTSELNRGYELAFFNGGGGRGSPGPMVTVSEAFKKPKAVLGGQYQIVHTLELREAFRGDLLEEVGLGCYEMVKPTQTWRFGKLLEAAIAGAAGEYDEGGGGRAGAGGGAGGGGGGAYGEDGDGGGVFGVLSGLFACLPCLAGSRADDYLEERGNGHRARGETSGGGARGGGGGGGQARRGAASGDRDRRQNGRSRGRDMDEQQEGGEGEEDGEDEEGGGRGRRRGGAKEPLGKQRSFKGGGANGVHAHAHVGGRLPPSHSEPTPGGRGPVSKQYPPHAASRGGSALGGGGLRTAASVGSSSGRSTQLASYDGRSKGGYGPAAAPGRRPGPGSSGLGPSASTKRIAQQRSSADPEEEEDDDD